MTIPSKQDFQELISFCKKDRFPKDVDIWPSRAKETVKAVLVEFVTCRENALEEMKTLVAFRWLNDRHGLVLSNAIKIIIPDPINLSVNWAEDKATYQTRNTESDIEKAEIYFAEKNPDADYFFYRIKESLDNLVGYDSYMIQRYERLVADIAYCVMEYKYPSKNITPDDFKTNIKSIIDDLKKAIKSEKNLKKYADLFYFSEHHKDDYLQNKLDLYTSIRDEYLFPVKQKKKEKDRYEQRMFVVSITKKIFLEMNALRDHDNIIRIKNKDIVDFINHLFYLECFDNPLTPGNVASAVKAEKTRLEKFNKIHSEYRIKMQSK